MKPFKKAAFEQVRKWLRVALSTRVVLAQSSVLGPSRRDPLALDSHFRLRLAAHWLRAVVKTERHVAGCSV